jgi:hypothetical protein
MAHPKTPTELAEERFARKRKQQEEGRSAMASYLADARATDQKTARLRALRLAKEAADAAAASSARAERAKPANRRKSSSQSSSRSGNRAKA